MSKLTRSAALVSKTKANFKAGLKSSKSFKDQNEELVVVSEYELATMNDLQENGWAHIHQAAFRCFHKSVEKFVRANEDQLELETGDDLGSTPLLLAVMNEPREPQEEQNKMDTVRCLVELGARIDAVNKQNHGIVELCAFKQFINVLEYFIELDDSRLPVWKNLIKFFGSDGDEEAESAAKCLKMMSMPGADGTVNPNWQPMFKNGVIANIAKIIKGTISDGAKIETFTLLLNLLPQQEIQEQFMANGGMMATIKHMRGKNNTLIMLSAMVIKELALVKDKDHADQAIANDFIQAAVHVMKTNKDPTVLVEAIMGLSNIVDGRPQHQTALGKVPEVFTAIVHLFESCSSKVVLLSLTHAVAKIVQDHKQNQEIFIEENIASNVIALTLLKHKDVQLKAVEAIQALALNNQRTQQTIKEEGAIKPLMQLLKKSRQTDILEQTAGALWALAGDDVEEQRKMAEEMGVQQLIEFLASLSESLHYIGSEGLGVLAQGPSCKQTEIAQASGVHPLVRLLRSDKEAIVLSIIRTLRHLCVGVGYNPHKPNQMTIAQSRGIKSLVAMMSHSKNELIQVEAAHTLGCVALGNPENLQEIKENIDFSYVRILKMMYSQDTLVRLLAGAALASFAYNNLHNQKDIAVQGGIRFMSFIPFLQSDNEFYRCNAAFQIVVLARIIPDEEQAISSAAGIKLLVDLLQDSKDKDILALSADCIARLSHTRAGVPSAFIAIQAVPLLCKVMTSQSEQARGCAAIALGYLSHYPDAKRQLLNSCRNDPYLMDVLMHFSKDRLSPEFMEGWSHYKKIGIPANSKLGRPHLISNTNDVYSKDPGKSLKLQISDDDDDASQSNLQVSQSNDDEKTTLTARSSSRTSHNGDALSQTTNNEQSMTSPRFRTSSTIPPEDAS